MRQSVLVINAPDETRAVLRTVFCERGIDIVEAPRASQGLELARQRRPDLIVLDLAVGEQLDGADDPADRLVAESQQQSTPLVILGKVRRPPATAAVVAKPYHYGPLIQRIESLLAARRCA